MKFEVGDRVRFAFSTSTEGDGIITQIIDNDFYAVKWDDFYKPVNYYSWNLILIKKARDWNHPVTNIFK